MSSHLALSPLGIAFVLSGVALLVLAAYLYPRRGSVPGARFLLWLLVANATWALVSAGAIGASDPATVRRFELLRIAVSGFSPVVWLLFALAYTGRADWTTPRAAAVLCLVPAVNPVLYATNDAHGLSYESIAIDTAPATNVVSYDLGAGLLFTVGYSYLLTLVGAFLIAQAAVTTRDLYRDQTVSLLVGAAAPLVANVALLAGLIPGANADVTPAALAVTGAAFVYALFRGELLIATPAVATLGERSAVESLTEGFIIADRTGTVVRANPAARAMLSAEAAVGSPLSSLFPEPLPERGRFEFSPADSGRTFEATVTPIETRAVAGVGRTVTVRDITDRKRRRERLEVLNRILRHNLRNELNVVAGRATLLSEGASDPEVAADAQLIRETADRLARLGEKAREFDETIASADGAAVEPVEVGAVVESVVGSVRADYPAVGLEVRREARHTVETDRDTLELVLRELVENAAKHNDADDPAVTVVVGDGEDGAPSVRILDNGPGIPENERRAVARGEETPLEHATRLGLWLARWGTRRLDGRLEFDERQPRGTEVAVRLPPSTTADRRLPASPE